MPAFEVASVKPVEKATSRINVFIDPGRATYLAHTAQMLVMKAYDLRAFQVAGPDWTGTAMYDVKGTIPANTPSGQVPLMLQRLLAESFKLAFHRTFPEMRVWALVLSKDEANLKPAQEESDDDARSIGGFRGTSAAGRRKITGRGRLDGLARLLSSPSIPPVVDMTGLKGAFDIDLQWELAHEMDGASDTAGPLIFPGPSLLKALQQYGLKLELRKAPVEVLVIDRAERNPAEN